MSDNYAINIKRGDTYKRMFLFETSAGTPIDISNTNFSLYIVKKGQTRADYLYEYKTQDGLQLKRNSANSLELNISDEETLSMNSLASYYYLCQFFSDGSVSTKLEGAIKICV